MYKYTGIDISKMTFDCCIETNAKTETKKFSNDLKGFEKLRAMLPENAHVVMEASGAYYYRLAFFLFEHNIRVSVVNPLIIRRFCQMRMTRTKTDKKDAMMIREYAILENPELWQPDDPTITRLKQLNAMIDLMDKNITSSSNQLEAFRQMPHTPKENIEFLEKKIKEDTKLKKSLEKEMDQIAVQNYSDTYKSLRTIPGIGPKAAAVLIAISGNFKKFNDYRQLVAYVGLNPHVFESGTSVKGKGHISKMGTARLRKILYVCAWSAQTHNPQCKEMNQRLKQKGKPNKVIKVALANKLLRQAFAVGKNTSTYQKNYQPVVAF